ncbi:restriction endonuclease [Streptomyces sp. NPDC002734]|uniref:restriction endonuclease n=1 Tax=Streptomyces sp. NPDC002734 TaxID=3154426 RepID=UPI003321F525
MTDMPQRAVQPGPMQIASWQEAERNAARWMRHWGYRDATAKPGGADGGVDVKATGALGQVKYQAAQVGRPELQRFVGARPYGSTAQLIFFTGSDYASTAVAYAEEWNIALFRYRLDGVMMPVNGGARRIAESSAPVGASMERGGGQADGKSFGERNWRVILGVVLLMAPIGSIGDPETYTGPLALDVLKGLGIFLALWGIGALLIGAHFGVRLSIKNNPPCLTVLSRSGKTLATFQRGNRSPGRDVPPSATPETHRDMEG